ncbi:dedicator of cytokinesis protein 9-like isoform X18 [Patiria miniata]|uniref:Dedicator of cytokinesis protein 9 n=1 Tax=Patiria miniata TaxID=46514 RepID=A0A913ZG62_PATMI|nr:dedicator of cytokinesis protein 9-like isoform X18 [Patiria miniata]
MASVNLTTRPPISSRSTTPKTSTTGKNPSSTGKNPSLTGKNPSSTHAHKTSHNDVHHQSSSSGGTKRPAAIQNSGDSVHNGQLSKSTPASGVTMKKPVARPRSGSGVQHGDTTKHGAITHASKTTLSKQGSGDKTPNGNPPKRVPISSSSKPTVAKRGSVDGAKSATPGPTNRLGVKTTVSKQLSADQIHNGRSSKPLSAARVAVPRKASSDGSLNSESSKRGSTSSSPRNSVSRQRSGDIPSSSLRKPIPLPRSVEQKSGLKRQIVSTHQTSTISAKKPIVPTRQTASNGAKASISSQAVSKKSDKHPHSNVSGKVTAKETVSLQPASSESKKLMTNESGATTTVSSQAASKKSDKHPHSNVSGKVTAKETVSLQPASSESKELMTNESGATTTVSSRAVSNKSDKHPHSNVSGKVTAKETVSSQPASSESKKQMTNASGVTTTVSSHDASNKSEKVMAKETNLSQSSSNLSEQVTTKETISTQSTSNESDKNPLTSSAETDDNEIPNLDSPRGIMRKAASEKWEREVAVKFTKKSSSVKTSPIHKAEATLRIMLAQSASASSARLASRTGLHGVTRTTSREKIDPISPQSPSPRTPTKPASPVSMATNGRKISTSSTPSQTSIREEEEAKPPPTPTSPAPAPSPVIDLFAEKQELIEPVHYEEHILKNRNVINNDPLRSLIQFPYDDLSASTLPRQLRTTKSTVPERALQEASSLFVKESINGYMTEWKVINNKYSNYGGPFQDVPGYQKEFQPHQLREQVYEVDDADENQEMTMNSPSGNIFMQGFLYKTPFGQQAGLIRAYKRRYFYLRQLADKSFLIEYHKDEKSNAAKGNLPLDSLVDVVKTGKQRKFGMELRMQDQSVQSIAAENQQQMDEWYSALKKVIEQQKQETIADKHSMSSMEDLLDQEEYADSGDSLLDKAGSKKQEKSKHPELQGYGKETEKTNSQKRKENRNNVFLLYPRMQGGEKVMTEPDCKPYEEEFGKRFVVNFLRLNFRLSATLGKDGEPIEGASDRMENIEQFFTSLALFDARDNRKLSEDFRIDLNNQFIRAFMDKCRDLPNGATAPGPGGERRRPSTLPNVDGLDENWLKYPQKAIFSVKKPHPEIYLVIRIEKVLQGGIAQCAEPYIKTGDVFKTCQKVMKQAKIFCSRMGQYRMPFAWTARRVFNDYSELDSTGDFFPLYRQESNKLSDEDLLKQLQDVRKNPEKLSKLTEIPGSVRVILEPLTRMLSNCLTSSLIPTMPWPEPPLAPPTLEVEEFLPEKGDLSQPFTTYTNNLYVYPVQLKYDSQKTFTKARNIALCVEFRDSDDEGAQPLKAIYGHPGGPVFVTSGSAAVLHHHQVPDFYEEIKIALPTQLHDKHHLLFRFYHVSCEVGKGTVKKRDTVDSFVGYAWIPLLDAGKPNCGDLSVCVSSNLPPGYLGSKGMGKLDLKLVDGGKQLLKVHIRLASTIYTTAHHLHNFFASCENWDSKNTDSVVQYIKAMHAVDTDALIKFLPVILNQLFRILPMAMMDGVQLNIVRLIVFIVSQVHEVGREDVLYSYVKYVFETGKETELQKTVHEELVKNLAMSLRPSTDHQVIKSLMKHMWFFFNIIIKSMAQYLIKGSRLDLSRIKRFSTNFQTGLRNLVQTLMPHILQKQDVRQRQDAKDANFHLANFIKRCFTYMDRGFVFRLVNCYMGFFSPDDPKPVFEMKFEMIRVLCSYEHYLALNLPLQKKGQQSGKNFKSTSGSAVASAYMGNMRKYVQIRPAKEQYKDLHYDYQLTEEYCQNHFLTGLLLREVGSGLHDVTEVRQNGIRVLRNLLAKHSFDDRFLSKQYQARIAALYLPLIAIILENAPRLTREAPPTPGSASMNGDSMFDISALSTSSLLTDSPGTDRSNSVTGSSKTKSLQRDSAVLDMIAGRDSSEKSDSQSTITGSTATAASASVKGHQRSKSTIMYDKLLDHEIKDLLICLLYIVKNVNEEVLLGWWSKSGEDDQIKLFDVLEMCLFHFQYKGKKHIIASRLREKPTSHIEEKSKTLPAAKARAMQTRSLHGELPVLTAMAEAESAPRVLQESNLSAEVSLIVLDVLGTYCTHFKPNLDMDDGDNPLMRKVMDIFLSFIKIGQSESLSKHVFASLRSFVHKFPVALFKGSAQLCGDLCLSTLKCLNSKLPSLRSEACALLYLIMKENYEFTSRKDFVRVHLQVVISVSKLIGDANSVRFQESLAMINNYAVSDKNMSQTQFPSHVKDLTKKIRTVLMATAQMKEHEKDPEMLVDLQDSLAKSYASTPELRRTWLESMAVIHINHSNYSEAAHCNIHIAALIAEYLKRKGIYPAGCQAFKDVSPNIESEERGMKDDTGLEDVQYSEQTLLHQLERCAEALQKAERYESMGALYKLIIPFYEKQRDYHRLAMAYGKLCEAYKSVMKVTSSGRRLLGQYFRVAFFGQHFEEDDGKEFIYKEPKITTLASICERLIGLYTEKFGKGNVKLIRDSSKVNPDDLDQKIAYIQLTFVKPYFDDHELQDRQTSYERNNNIRRFLYETPFTEGGKARGTVEEQCKLKTMLTTSHAFPYVKKRIQVVYQFHKKLNPIQVAIDEVKAKVQELNDVIETEQIDMKRLQLLLQGCVSTQVNAGPQAYALAFLGKGKEEKWDPQDVWELKKLFREFVEVCGKALSINARLIKEDQHEYHDDMVQKYRAMAAMLAELLQDQMKEQEAPGRRVSGHFFNAISGM